MGQKIGQKVPKNAKKSQNTFVLISIVRKLLDQSKYVTGIVQDKNGPKKMVKKC